MADRAVGREPGRNMVWHRAAQRCGALPVGGMATVTGSGTQREVVAYVAGRAGSRRRGNVHSRQGKPCRAVVKRRCVPTHGGVASGTVRNRESGSGRGVRRSVRLLPVR